MFNFFVNLFMSIIKGQNFFSGGMWSYPSLTPRYYSTSGILFKDVFTNVFNIFNNTGSNAFSEDFFGSIWIYDSTPQHVLVGDISLIPYLISCILSLVCCIGLFFIIVKAVKKLFTCFLDF